MNKKRRTELDIDPSIIAEKPPPEKTGEQHPPPPSAPPEAEKPRETPEEPKPGKRRINYLKLSLLALTSAALLGVAAAIGFALISVIQSLPEKTAEEEPEKTPPAPLVPQEPEPAEKAVEIPDPPLYEFEPFFVSLGREDDISLIRVGFAAKMSGKDVEAEIERNLTLVRENIYFVLGEKGLDDFRKQENREKTAVEVAIAINRSIQSGAVEKVLVTSLTIR
ncbi:MAG: flagellar basal body-associated FliL family protein [Candidatus Nitrospinota bacterium M3_3B_026]